MAADDVPCLFGGGFALAQDSGGRGHSRKIRDAADCGLRILRSSVRDAEAHTGARSGCAFCDGDAGVGGAVAGLACGQTTGEPEYRIGLRFG
jgi:hypothetical protein